jgi:hypothetical protein
VIGIARSGSNFAGLGKYLGERQARVEWTTSRNIMTDDPRFAALIMQATADQNRLVSKPVYHVSISWAPEDHPTRAQMEEAADRMRERLGLHDHQAVMVAHNDQQYAHLHMMINRVHPETGAAWSSWQDHRRVHILMRELERDMGFRVTPSSYRYREPGQPHIEPDTTRGLTVGERQQLEHTSTEPLVLRVRAVADDLRVAQSWAELSERAAAHGLAVERKHGGIVFTDGVTAVKGSRIGRDLAMQQLEARYREPFPKVLPTPDVARLAADVRALHTAETLARVSAVAAEAVERARRAVGTAERAAERVVLASRHFDADLAKVYGDPAAARRAYDGLVREHGFGHANATLANTPERLGALRAEDVKMAWGLRAEHDLTAARAAVPLAARSGADLMRADEHARAAGSPETVRAAVFGAESAAASARDSAAEHARRHASTDELRRSIGVSLDRLLPREIRQVQQLLTAPEFALAQWCRNQIRDLFRGREGPAFS